MKITAVWKTLLASALLGTALFSSSPIHTPIAAAASVAYVTAAEPTAFTPPSSNRIDYNFNLDWKFIQQDVPGAEAVEFDDSAWETVSLPHTFNDVDSFDEYITSSGEPHAYKGIVWYRKHFQLDETLAGRKVLVEFEGVRQAAEVYVNGAFVGLYENGVTAFGFDISDYVNFEADDNVIAVKANNSTDYAEKSSGVNFQWESRDFNPNFGGLTRDVRLHVMDKAYMTLPIYEGLQTTGSYIYPSNISTENRTADITVESQVKNDYDGSKTLSMEAVVVDKDGHAVKTIAAAPVAVPQGGTYTFKMSDAMAGLHLWEPDYPYLYTVYCILKDETTVLDVYPIQTGFRKVDFRGGAATGGVYINNKLVYLSGYAQRSSNEWAALGGAVPDWMHDYDGELIKESNANLVRWMHVAAQPADIRTGDKYGIVAVMPAGDKEGDSTGRQWEQRVEVMRDTMIYFRNNPSILFWEAGNNAISAAHMKEMNDLKQQWDPNGMRAIGSRALSEDPSYGGQDAVDHAEYVGTMLNRHYTDYTRDRVPLIESEYTRDEAPRRVWDDYSPPDFDYVHAPGTTYDWTSEQFASTLAAVSRYEFWGQRIQGPGNSQYSGSAALTWADSNQHGRQPLTENSRVSGRVDAVRIPKESFYSYRVMQSSKPDIHIIGHWSYPAGTVKTMYVMASHVAKVELFVNGVSKGISTAPSYDFLYTFPNITWEAGTIRAVGYDSSDRIVADTQLETAGAPASIKLTVRTGPHGLAADGADVAMIDVEVVDAEGRRVPTDQARIDFTVTGPAVFEGGWNSGKLDSVHKSYVDTEAGVNRVFVRSTRTAGTIAVTATRDGLTLGQTVLESHSIDSANGLTTVMPAVNAPVLPVSVPDYGPDETPGVNVAPDKQATADSSQANNSPGNAIDGEASTRWAAADDTPGHWWQIDLGSLQPVGGAEIEWYRKDTAYQYKIEVSADNATWTEVTDKTNNRSTQLKQTSYFAAFARYVRITVTGGGWASFREVRIFKNESVSENWNIVNIALKQPVTASSEEGSNRAARAVDGITTTRWSALTGKAGEWLQVDLGENRSIVGSEVLWYRADRAYQYKIEVSEDNVNWTKVVDATDNLTPDQKQSDPFKTVARYVRITVTGGSWAAISEFKVLGNLIEEPDDQKAPVTTAVIDPAVPDGSNNWYRKPVRVTLQASDDSETALQTQYSLDGGATWAAYLEPITLSLDGIYQLQYFSKDETGNTEAVQSLDMISLDQTAPVITINVSDGGTYTDDQTETVQYTVSDQMSGAADASVAAILDGQPIENGESLELYKLPLGEHVLTVMGEDQAGNSAEKSLTFTTAASIGSLEALVETFLVDGSIDNRGIANSLQSKLQSGNLESFQNEVEAQDGKHISGEAAAILLRDARYLLEQ